MVVDIMAQCCSVFLNATDFYLMVDTDRVPKYIQILDHPTKALDIGNPQLVLSGLENPSTPRCLHQTLHYGLATHSTSRHFGQGLFPEGIRFIRLPFDSTMILQTLQVRKKKKAFGATSLPCDISPDWHGFDMVSRPELFLTSWHRLLIPISK
jgi:hypothetical protein